MKERINDTANLYQKESNCVWYTNTMFICDLCKKKSTQIYQIIDSKDKIHHVCSTNRDNDCFKKAFEFCFNSDPDCLYVKTRIVQYEQRKK